MRDIKPSYVITVIIIVAFHVDIIPHFPLPLSKNVDGYRMVKRFYSYSRLFTTFYIILIHCLKRNKEILLENVQNCKRNPPRRGIEPRSPAWQAGILTTILTRTRYKTLVQMITQTYWSISTVFLKTDHFFESHNILQYPKPRKKKTFFVHLPKLR